MEKDCSKAGDGKRVKKKNSRRGKKCSVKGSGGLVVCNGKAIHTDHNLFL
jgi:hypothetical protein